MSDNHTAFYYVRWYLILLVLLVISVVGPELEIKVLTLVTAFGIAFIKAWIVAAYFMHLNKEKRYIHYMLYTMVAFMALFYFGIAADINKFGGSNWVNKASLEWAELKQAEIEGRGKEH